MAEHTAEGVRSVMGGGVLGALALLIITMAAIGAGVMTQYSGSLALQIVGLRVRRPLSAAVVTVLASALILWLLRRAHRDAIPGCRAAGELLDSSVRGRCRHRLADQNAG